MNKAEFEQFKSERATVNRKASKLKKSVQNKAIQYLKDVQGVDIRSDKFSFRSYGINENSIYGVGAIELEVRGDKTGVEKTYKIPRSYVFPSV